MSATAKAIAKRLKQNGLQRLRWYCEMCKKQCRDENGFKNHCASEGHLREMEKFSSDSQSYIEKFSKDFEKSYLDVLSHNHHTKRVNANYVYNELIQDRTHVHMNATRWDSLASFVKYLGETGKCEVDETERGWFVRWIDPEEKKREMTRRRRDEEDARVDQRRQAALFKRMKNLSETGEQYQETSVDDEVNDDRPIESTMVLDPSRQQKSKHGPAVLFSSVNDEAEEAPPTPEHRAPDPEDQEISTWLLPEIVVRINSSKVGPGLKNEKAVVLDVKDDNADLILLRTGEDIFGVPSKRLESVIPRVGGQVIVLGLHPLKGRTGVVADINVGEYKAHVKLKGSNEIKTFEFEDISKIYDESSGD